MQSIHAAALALCLLAVPVTSPAPSHADDDGRFLWLSDIHLDMFYYDKSSPQAKREAQTTLKNLVDDSDPQALRWKDHSQWGPILDQSVTQGGSYNARGSDANHKLLQAVLDQASRVLHTPEFIVITGDHLGHDFGANYAALAPTSMQTAALYNDFATQTLAYIAKSVRDHFDHGAPIFATLGNNDAYCGDYDIRLDQPDSTFLADTAATFLRYFLPDLSPDEEKAFRATFLEGGYYLADLPVGDDKQLVVLNSIPFMDSDHYPQDWSTYSGSKTICAKGEVLDPAKQLSWFTDLVDNGSGQAWVALHVPPGIGCYGSSKDWTADRLTTFKNAFLGDGGLSLAGTFAAHSHMDSFKLMRDGSGKAVSFVLQGPSVSPNHSNNPSFRVVTYDPKDLHIVDHDTHYIDLNTGWWSSFSFDETYGATAVDTESLEALYQAMVGGDAHAWELFVSGYTVRTRLCTDSIKTDCVSLGKLSAGNLECIGSLE